MGYYLQIDTQDAVPVASLSGWGAMIKWVGSLPPSARALHHLVLYGWGQDVPATTTALKTALETSPPTIEPTLHTAQNLLSVLQDKAKGASVITITDGLG